MSKDPPAPSQPLDPEAVGDDITHFLGHSWFFDPQTINVSILGGKVTLEGTVRSEREPAWPPRPPGRRTASRMSRTSSRWPERSTPPACDSLQAQAAPKAMRATATA